MEVIYDTVTVITVTRNRSKFLKRAIDSVKNQDYQGKIHHFIYIDDCKETIDFLTKNYCDDDDISWYYYKRKETDVSGPVLLASLRNDSIGRTDGQWLSYLDDDNVFHTDHIRKLYEFAKQNNYNAVHSHIRMFNRDGSEFLDEYWPWARADKTINKYQFMLQQGLVEKGSNIRKYKYGIVIDTNVWLVRREIWEQCKIPDSFTSEDWENNLAEDDKLMMKMIEMGIEVYTNDEATVDYYLGGYSNIFDGSVDKTELWKKI